MIRSEIDGPRLPSRPRITRKALRRAFADVVRPEQEVVVLFSGLWSIAGRFYDNDESTCPVALDALADVIIDEMLEFLGPERSLILPTYSSSFSQDRRYDPANTKPYTGAVPSASISRREFRRTLSPIGSYTVSGPRANEVLGLRCTTAWGDDGVLAWFEKVDARICTLGVSMANANGYVHRVEEALGVPYRYFKRFVGTIVDPTGRESPCAEVMYVRPLGVPVDWQVDVVYNEVKARQRVTFANEPSLSLCAADTSDLRSASFDLVGRDPYAYVRNCTAVEAWVKNGKALEMAALKPGERWP
jgi:aminoglycoside 3-N-acetyltransferase